MKRPDLEMIRRIKKQGQFSDLNEALNLPFFYMSYQPMQEFEFHANSTVEGIEDRNVKLDDGREVYRQHCGAVEWVYDDFVMSARQKIWVTEDDWNRNGLYEITYWGRLTDGEDGCRLYLAGYYPDNNYLWEWEGSLVVDYDYVEADHDVKKVKAVMNPDYEQGMRLLYKNLCDMDAIAPAVDFDGFMTGFRQHAMEFYIFASRLMWHLKYGDKHAVEVTPAKPPKVNPVVQRDRPWAGATGPQVLLLDRMPATQSKGTGTHASPKPHRRRGHWKTLSHPRFRHHPKYQQKIYVKPSFVGPRQATYEGNIYRLVEPLDGLEGVA